MSPERAPARRIVTLQVFDHGELRRVEAEEGTTVREALLGAGISPYAELTRRLNCGGRGLCATCGVRVIDPAPAPTHWHDRLAAAWGYPRLSCQIEVRANLAIALVDKIVWGARVSRASAFRFDRALLASAVATPLAMGLLFEVAITLFPARTPEGNGLMPIGQAGFALIVGSLVGLFAAWRAGRPVASRSAREKRAKADRDVRS